MQGGVARRNITRDATSTRAQRQPFEGFVAYGSLRPCPSVSVAVGTYLKAQWEEAPSSPLAHRGSYLRTQRAPSHRKPWLDGEGHCATLSPDGDAGRRVGAPLLGGRLSQRSPARRVRWRQAELQPSKARAIAR